MSINNYYLNLDKQAYSDFSKFLEMKPTSWIWIKEGNLEEVHGLFDTLKYLFYKSHYQMELEQRTGHLTLQLNEKQWGFLYLNQTPLKKLFFEHLSKLDQAAFNRANISQDSYLEKTLKSPSKKSQGRFDSFIEEAKFALSLGVHPELCSSGTSGTYFISTRFREKIGVFKPWDETNYGKNNPRPLYHLFKKYIRSFLKSLGVKYKELHLMEAAASSLSKTLNLNITPETEVVELESDTFSGERKVKEGSFQLFVKGKEAEEKLKIPSFVKYFPMWLSNWVFDNIPFISAKLPHFPENFFDLVLFDFLTLNNDRKFDNWFIHRNRAIAIDNAHSFPTKNIRGYNTLNPYKLIKAYISRKHFFRWEVLPITKKPFPEEHKKLILSLSPERCLKVLDSFKKYADPPKVSDHIELRKEAFRKRIVALQKLVAEDTPIRKICSIMKTKHLIDELN